MKTSKCSPHLVNKHACKNGCTPGISVLFAIKQSEHCHPRFIKILQVGEPTDAWHFIRNVNVHFISQSSSGRRLCITLFKCPLKCRPSSSSSAECSHCRNVPLPEGPSLGRLFCARQVLPLEPLGAISILGPGHPPGQMTEMPKRFYQNTMIRKYYCKQNKKTAKETSK